MPQTNDSKHALRRYLRAQRASLDACVRERASADIARRLFELGEWRAAEVVLCYLSFGEEVATDKVVRRAWAEGKRVAAPRVAGPHQMEWHWVAEGDPLEKSRFGILEPPAKGETLVGPDVLGAVAASGATAPLGVATTSAVAPASDVAPAPGFVPSPGFVPMPGSAPTPGVASALGDAPSSSASLAPAAAPTSSAARVLAIVPALAFDRQCLRIGYGGGFYDTFLANFVGHTIGLCYEALLQEDLAALGCAQSHDLPVDAVITESGIFRRV